MASLQRRNCPQVSNDVGEIALFQPGIERKGHRRLEHPLVAGYALRDRAGNLLGAPPSDAGCAIRSDVGGCASCTSSFSKDPAAMAQSGFEVGYAARPCRVAFHAMADGGEIGATPDRIVEHGFVKSVLR